MTFEKKRVQIFNADIKTSNNRKIFLRQNSPCTPSTWMSVDRHINNNNDISNNERVIIIPTRSSL